MLVLGIESSCDETAAAVMSSGKILSSLVATQHDVHERFGGVVPELASRRHMENIVPLVRGALSEADVEIEDLEGIAVTCAPGLAGSLLVGISFAKGLAYTGNIPIVGVNHLEGHLNAASLEYGEIEYPYVGLVVSGGHTSLYFVSGFGKYKLLGATRDDAAGEAFDKVAKLLSLGYPGGPAIDRAAEKGDPRAFRFTAPKFSNKKVKGKYLETHDFSFSGIKTAVLNVLRENEKKGKVSDALKFDIAASFQNAVVNVLVERLLSAASSCGSHTVVISGGVAANRLLRKTLADTCRNKNTKCYIPSMKFCTDNAAMVAYVGERYLAAGKRDGFDLNAIATQEIGV